MCRSIRTLRSLEPAHDGDVEAAARQYVRKLSDFRVPSRAHADAFDTAVAEVAAATSRLLAAVGPAPVPGPETRPPPSTRSR